MCGCIPRILVRGVPLRSLRSACPFRESKAANVQNPALSILDPMPELPEVESIRRYLIANDVEDSLIERVEVGWADSVAIPQHDIELFADRVSHRRIGSIRRRGKYLIFPLTDGMHESTHLVLHMGMTGSLHLREADQESVRFRRAAMFLGDGRRIELNDYRRWARLWAVDDPTLAFPRLGPEPWDIAPDDFAARVRAKRSRIKPALLEQSLIAGVGNIYADEALHRSGISPLRRCNRISITRLRSLHRSIIDVLEHAVEFISTHPSPDGSPFVVDAYDERMRIVRKSSSICPDCDAPIRSQKIAGRTAYYCLTCQH